VTDALTDKQPTAVLFRRYLAHILDFFFHLGTVAVPFWLLATRSTVDVASGDPYADTFPQGADRAIRIDDRLFVFDRNELILIAAVSAAVTLLFLVVIQGRFGWTVGKLLTGLRTVKGDGERPGIIRAFLRTVLLPIDALPSTPFLPLVGGLVALFTDTNRRIGDLLAGTYVVRRSAWGSDPTGKGGIDTTGWEALGDEPSPVTTLAEGEALRVGDATDPAATETFTAPAPAAAPTAEAGAGKAPAYQPQWDPARQAYLQWHPGKQQWLQFDDASGEWRPIG
jgi:uncharacterized RDD family membrane protein YckC